MVTRVVVIFPRFEQIDLIEQLRGIYDPLASSIEPHITLVFPFESDIAPQHIRYHIEQSIHSITPFPIVLRGVTGHEGEYLFLNVKHGNDQLIELHDRLYTGLLASHLNDQHTFVPHLTVGRLPDNSYLMEALNTARTLKTTFETQVKALSVYAIQSDGTRSIEFEVIL